MKRRLLLYWFFLSFAVVAGPVLPSVRFAAAGPCPAAVVRDDEGASRILAAERPFAPANHDRFLTYTDPDWSDMEPLRYLAGPGPTEAEAKEELRTFLERRFPCSPDRVLAGLAAYDDPTTRLKISDPVLRAALAALTGTLGEPAIDYLQFDAPVASIHFGVPFEFGDSFPSDASGRAYHSTDGTWSIVVDGRYRFDPFGSFSALLFHELLHIELPPDEPSADAKPDGAGLPEEATASALEALVYMQMLLTDPTLARLPDPLTRGVNNYNALVRLNSGVPGTDRLNLFVPDGDVNIDPLATAPLTEYYEHYAYNSIYNPEDQAFRDLETRGNPLLAAVLANLAEPGRTPPASPDFDRATLDFVDQNQGVLSPGELIAVACILELDVDCG